MIVPTDILPFWAEFQAKAGSDTSDRFYEAFHFDDNELNANMLAELVLLGIKRATAGLLWSFEAENKTLPKPGDLSVVTNWQREPLCIIETTDAVVVHFDEVTAKFAATEGEGDKTLRHWREVHWSYFGRECKRIGKEPTKQMPVLCEVFSVVYTPSD